MVIQLKKQNQSYLKAGTNTLYFLCFLAILLIRWFRFHFHGQVFANIEMNCLRKMFQRTL
jgi:hypothetical protein